MKAVIYARFSSARQNETSISGQLRICENYAKSKKYEIVDTYVDRAISGTTDKRPQFQQMIQDSNNGAFDIVLVYKIDRFSRNRYNAQIYRKKLQDNNVQVISCTELIEQGSNGIIMEALYDGFAEWYSANLSENVKRGMKENAKLGNFLGGVIPLGYKVENKKLVIDEQRAKAVQIVFDLYIKGYCHSEIAETLNALGYTNNKGGEFNSKSFQHVLTNTKYIGTYNICNENRENEIPQIITKETFDKAQKIRQSKRLNKRAKSGYILSTILKCSCGGKMNGYSCYNKQKIKYQYYRCKECKQIISKSELEDKVIDLTINHILKSDFKKVIAENMYKLNQQQNNNNLQEKEIKKQIKENEKEINKGVKYILTHDNVPQALTDQINGLEDKNKELTSQLQKIEINKTHKISMEDIESFLDNFTSLKLENQEERNIFIHGLIKSVELSKDQIKISYTFDSIADVSVFKNNGGRLNKLIELTPKIKIIIYTNSLTLIYARKKAL